MSQTDSSSLDEHVTSGFVSSALTCDGGDTHTESSGRDNQLDTNLITIIPFRMKWSC